MGDEQLDVKVLSVSYPPNEAALVWTVGASDSGSARVRISYLLGNLTKSFNYRAVASTTKRRSTSSQYMRLQNFANEEFGSTGLWAGFGKRFLKPIGLNETKEMLVEKFEKVPIKKTYTCNPQEFDYLDQPQNKLRVPMHYVLKNDKAHQPRRAPLPYGKVRIFIEGGGTTQARPRSSAKTGASSRRWTTRCGSTSAWPRTSSSSARSRRTKRKRVAGNLYDHEVIVKYEIENFKDQPVTLDVVENLRHVRNEVRGDTGRDVEWELRQGDDVRRRPRRGAEHVRAARVPRRAARRATRTARRRRSCTSCTSSSRTSGNP